MQLSKFIRTCFLVFGYLFFCTHLKSQPPAADLKNSSFKYSLICNSDNFVSLDHDLNNFSIENKHLSALCTVNYFYKKSNFEVDNPSLLVGFNKLPSNITIKKNLSKFVKTTPYGFDRDSIQFKDLLPDAFWLGYNYNMNNYFRKPDSSSFHDAWSIEAGIGKYYYERDDRIFPSEWILGGGGIGFEYRQLFDNDKNNLLDTAFVRNFKKVYLNIRAELGVGFQLFNRDWFLHAQFGYTTNFSQNYLRPGIGISLGRLQFGFEDYWRLNQQKPKVMQSGFYLRYIITFNNYLTMQYKRKIDWDGRN